MEFEGALSERANSSATVENTTLSEERIVYRIPDSGYQYWSDKSFRSPSRFTGNYAL